jgi:hypothetical protein
MVSYYAFIRIRIKKKHIVIKKINEIKYNHNLEDHHKTKKKTNIINKRI